MAVPKILVIPGSLRARSYNVRLAALATKDPRVRSCLFRIAAVRGTGGLFAVQDFSQAVAILSLEQQEQKVASLLGRMGVRAAEASEDARKTCEKEAGLAGTGARSMVRFETPDLGKFPEEVERKIRNRASNKAAVGACRASGATGFARYRIAVLFF